MSKNLEFSDLTALFKTQNICSQIDNSELSRRINRLKPEGEKKRPKTQSVLKREKKQFPMIPELKAAVEVLKTRLSEVPNEKSVSRPCTRLKVDRLDSVSPGVYHKPSQSTGGWEFSKVPRLEDSITHQLSALVSHKTEKPVRKTKKVKNFEDFRITLHEKIRSHNAKVVFKMKETRWKKTEENLLKKKEFLEKTENLKWKENFKDEISKSQKLFSQILVIFAGSFSISAKIKQKKRTREKVLKFLRFLRNISKFLGIFMVTLSKKRKFLQYKNVRGLAGPLIAFISHEYQVFEKSISKYMYKLVHSHQLMLLMSFWKQSVVKIQQAFRRYCKVKEARLAAISIIYSKVVPTVPQDRRRVSLVPLKNFLNVGGLTARQKRTLFLSYLSEFLLKHVREKNGGLVKLYTEKTAMVSYLLIRTNGLGKLPGSKKRNTADFAQASINLDHH